MSGKVEMPKKGNPDQFDWVAIEREYRAGQLSNVEIAKQFGCSEGAIRKRAKRDGWQKNLIKKVNERVREKQVRETVRNDTARDEEIIEQAANRTLKVVNIHRKDAKQQRELVKKYLGLLEKSIAGLKKKKTPDLESTKAMSLISWNAARALDKLVGIERKAYNMDFSSTDENTPDSISITFHRKE